LDAGMRGGAGWRRGGGVHGGPTACMAVMVGAWRCGGGSSRGLQWPAGGPVVASMCFLLSFIDFRNSLSRAWGLGAALGTELLLDKKLLTTVCWVFPIGYGCAERNSIFAESTWLSIKTRGSCIVGFPYNPPAPPHPTHPTHKLVEVYNYIVYV
jgi:hypothetical protein